MDIAALKAAFGAYYRQEGQSARDFDTSFFQPLITERFFNSRPTVQTQERRVKSIIGQILNKWQKAITAEESLSMLPRSINLHKLSYEVKDTPDEIEASYAGFMALLDTNDKRLWPIVRYIVDVLMIQKGREEYELNEIYKGVDGVIVPGSKLPPGENFPGLEGQMNAFIDEGAMAPVDGPSAWSTTPATFVDEVRGWVNDVKASDNEARLLVDNAQIDYIFMSPDKIDVLAEGVFEKYSKQWNAANIDIMKTPIMIDLPFSRLKAVGLPSMIGKDRIFMTPSANRAAFIKKPKSEAGPHVQEKDREVQIFADFWKGVGFWHPEYVYTSQHEVPED
jgi:hypothetical protein